ncbi:MAG: helix-turn-helix transcriptional regulator [Chitinophagales bacterium]|jgi:ArsR family transcriptional regulator|nr:helix-turn-helix transcriptional regulator [Chitinophagales bacterium]
MAETLMLDYSLAKKGLGRIKALAHPLRLSILAFIDKHGEINVNKIYRALKLEQSITSQHLKILRNAELVKFRRDGKKIFYSVYYSNIKQLMATIKKFETKK